MGPIPKAGAFPPIGAHGVSIFPLFTCQRKLERNSSILIFLAMPLVVQPFQPVVSPAPGAIAGWMSGTNPSLPHAAVAAGSPGLVQPSSAGQNVLNDS